MTTSEAASCVFHFGSYKGRTIDEISRTDDGMRYLDWIRDQQWFKIGVRYQREREAVATFLASPGVARELDELIGDNE
jgi:hypothetical protein